MKCKLRLSSGSTGGGDPSSKNWKKGCNVSPNAAATAVPVPGYSKRICRELQTREGGVVGGGCWECRKIEGGGGLARGSGKRVRVG